MTVFVIRDDDTCGFTKPEEIQACYEEIWSEAPVSLSVTPFRIPGNDRNLPDNLMGCNDVFPLHENTDLVHMLKEQIRAGYIDVSLHGYHHLCYNGHPEYIGGTGLTNKTREGRAYLEGLFGIDVLSFVPPHNSIGLSGLDAISASHMNLVNVPSLYSGKQRSVTARSLINAPAFYWHKKVRRMGYPYILNLGDRKEVEFHTVGPKSCRKELFIELDYCCDQDGVFVLSTHYHAFERLTQDGYTVRTLVYDLINRAMARKDVNFLGINSIW